MIIVKTIIIIKRSKYIIWKSIQAPPTCSPLPTAIWKPEPRPQKATAMDYKEVLGRDAIKRTFYQNNNTIAVGASVTITLSCSMTFTSFPFDTQRCNLEMRLPGMTPKLLGVNLTDSDTLGYKVQVCVFLWFAVHCVKVLPLDEETTSVAGLDPQLYHLCLHGPLLLRCDQN